MVIVYLLFLSCSSKSTIGPFSDKKKPKLKCLKKIPKWIYDNEVVFDAAVSMQSNALDF